MHTYIKQYQFTLSLYETFRNPFQYISFEILVKNGLNGLQLLNHQIRKEKKGNPAFKILKTSWITFWYRLILQVVGPCHKNLLAFRNKTFSCLCTEPLTLNMLWAVLKNKMLLAATLGFKSRKKMELITHLSFFVASITYVVWLSI